MNIAMIKLFFHRNVFKSKEYLHECGGESSGILNPWLMLGPPGSQSAVHREDNHLASQALCVEGLKMWLVWSPKDAEKIQELTGLTDEKSKTLNFAELSTLLDAGLPAPTLVLQQPGDIGTICITNDYDKVSKKIYK